MENVAMQEKVIEYWGAGFPVLYLNTFEETKGIDFILDTNSQLNDIKEVLVWCEGEGLNLYKNKLLKEKNINGTSRATLTQMLNNTLMKELDVLGKERPGRRTIILNDVHYYLEDPEVIILLKRYIKKINAGAEFNFVFISPVVKIPKELEKFITIIELEDMKEDEIKNIITKKIGKTGLYVHDDYKNRMATTLAGMTEYEINSLLELVNEVGRGWTDKSIELVQEQKKQMIKKSGILEMVTVKETIDDIGGLENLKEWLQDKAVVIKNIKEAEEYGVTMPKGVLIAGVPGCGKSLSAKAAAKLFNVPLLRMDMGRLMGKYVGESEGNLRNAIKLAEAMAPCVLWIDELEKAFAGLGGRSGSEVTTRLFGNFLTWMQEKEKPVFVVATANNIKVLPPELMRKGRFDEIFYVELPKAEEREKIFEIHIAKRRKQDFGTIDLKQLVTITEGYSGSDIEGVVKDAVEKIFIREMYRREMYGKLQNQNPSDEKPVVLTTKDIVAMIEKTKSLSVIMEDALKKMKEVFEKGRFKNASK